MADKNTQNADAPTDTAPDDAVANTAAVEQQDNGDNRPQLTDQEKEEATKEGLKDAVKEKAQIASASFDDLPGAPPSTRYHNSDEIQQWAYLLDLGPDAFAKRVSLKPGADSAIPDEKVYGLLALERNGQNRTPYVKAMMKRLDLKASELPGGGPSYTNDLTSISDL